MAKISFLSSNNSFEVPAGTDLINAYKMNPAIPLKFGCTLGNCGVCAIQVTTGHKHLTKITKQERQLLKDKCDQGYRLACQCAINGDIELN
jgi:ferredoxin